MRPSSWAFPPIEHSTTEKRLAKGNVRQQKAPLTPSRDGAPSALEWVRQAAGRDKNLRFTALLHHIYDLDMLKTARWMMTRFLLFHQTGHTTISNINHLAVPTDWARSQLTRCFRFGDRRVS
jgi:hypothetical protein